MSAGTAGYPRGSMQVYAGAVAAPEVGAVTDSLEMARMLATEAKRKAQRLLGAQAALEQLSSQAKGGRASAYSPAEAKAELEQAQARLSRLLETNDGGDEYKRLRRDLDEAECMSDFVRATPAVRLYREAVDGEEAEARRALESGVKPKAELSEAKARLAYCQGVLYALLEAEAPPATTATPGDSSGLTPPRGGSWAAQAQEWAREAADAQAVAAAQRPHLERRRQAEKAFHKEQGWRKASERFGALCGLAPADMRTMQMDILNQDAQHLRAISKGRLTALSGTHADREAGVWELQCSLGAVGFLIELTAMPEVRDSDAGGLLAFLGAEEYEASLEASVVRASLAQLAPRADQSLRLRLAWHSAAGEHAVAAAIGGSDAEEAAAHKLREAHEQAAAAEPPRREHEVLQGKLGKLEGKLQVIQALKSTSSSSAAAVAPLLASSKRKVTRLTAKVAGLDIALTRYEKSRANLHVAGGALIFLRRIARAATLRPLAEPNPFSPKPYARTGSSAIHSSPGAPADVLAGHSTGPAVPALTTGGLTADIRSFLRNHFAPMVRAAFGELLIDTPADALPYLAQWFWMHSELAARPAVSLSAAGGAAAAGGAGGREAVKELRAQVLATRLELLRVTRTIGEALPPEQQLRAADDMLRMLRLPETGGAGTELPPYYTPGAGYGDVGGASALAGQCVRFAPPGSAPAGNDASVAPVGIFFAAHASANGRLLDAVASVMLQYPIVSLRISVDEDSSATTAAAADAPAAAAGGLARRRATAIADAVVQRSVPSDRVSACVVPSRSGRRPQLELILSPNARASSADTLYAAAAPLRPPVPPAADPAAAAAVAHKSARRDALLHAVRNQYRDLQAQAAVALALPAPVELRVSVTEVRLVSTAQVAGAGELAICIAFGMERANHQSEASFQVSDSSVDELDIELWDTSRARLLGACALSVASLLGRDQAAMAGEVPLTPVGGGGDTAAAGSLGSLQVEVRASHG